MKKIIALSLMFFLFLSCSSLGNLFEEPEVKFLNLALDSIDAESATFLVKLDVFNPNSIGLPLSSIGYDLKLNNFRFAQGVIKKGISLAAKKNSLLELPIRVEFAKVADGMDSLFQSRNVNYDLAGAVGVGPFRVPYSEKGIVELENITQKSLIDKALEFLK